MKSVYIGGMFNSIITSDNEWKLDLSQDIRTFLVGDIEKYSESLSIKGTNITYNGPFYCEIDNNNVLASVGKSVVTNELKMIEKSDIIVMYFNNNISAGSSVELTYASSKHKRVIIIYTEYEQGNTHCENPIIRNEHWFAIECALELNKDNTTIIGVNEKSTTKEIAHKIKQELINLNK